MKTKRCSKCHQVLCGIQVPGFEPPGKIFVSFYREDTDVFGIADPDEIKAKENARGGNGSAHPLAVALEYQERPTVLLLKLREWASTCGSCCGARRQRDPHCLVCADTWTLIEQWEAK